ncbi:MAG: hypothetical protein ACP5IC_00290 [Minisyncoccia bacterium]
MPIGFFYLLVFFIIQVILFKLNKRQYLKYCFLFSFIFYLFLFLYLSLAQYNIWLNDSFAKYLLPPYQSIKFFLTYTFFHFAYNYIISFGFALLILGISIFLNQKYQNLFFQIEEPYIFATILFVLSLKYMVVYLFSIFIIATIINIFLKNKSERLSLYWLWIPSALFILLLEHFHFFGIINL